MRFSDSLYYYHDFNTKTGTKLGPHEHKQRKRVLKGAGAGFLAGIATGVAQSIKKQRPFPGGLGGAAVGAGVGFLASKIKDRRERRKKRAKFSDGYGYHETGLKHTHLVRAPRMLPHPKAPAGLSSTDIKRRNRAISESPEFGRALATQAPKGSPMSRTERLARSDLASLKLRKKKRRFRRDVFKVIRNSDSFSDQIYKYHKETLNAA